MILIGLTGYARVGKDTVADYLVAEEVVTDISHEGLRQLLREEGVSFQALRTWKRSNEMPRSRSQSCAGSGRPSGISASARS